MTGSTGLPPSDVIAAMLWFVSDYCDVGTFRDRSVIVQKLILDEIIPTDVLAGWATLWRAGKAELTDVQEGPQE